MGVEGEWCRYEGHRAWDWGNDGYRMMYWSGIDHTISLDALDHVIQVSL